MEITIHFKDLVYLGSHLIGIVISAVLIYVGLKKYPANVFLGLSFFCLTYGTFVAWLVYSGNFVHFPALYRTGNIGGLLFPPLFYLYLRYVVLPNSRSVRDLVYFLPVFLFVLDYSHVLFGMSVAEKRDLIAQEVYDPQLFVSFNQSLFLPRNFHTLFRTLVILFFWILSVRILVRRFHRQAILVHERPWLNWMLIYLVLLGLMVFPFLLAKVLQLGKMQYDLSHLTGSVLLLLSGSAMVFFPEVLYGTRQPEYTQNQQKEKMERDPKGTEPITTEKKILIQTKLAEVLDQKKAFQKKGYTLADLAKDTEIPAYQLTYYINHIQNSTFPDLINKHRIEETCRIIESGRFQHLTLEALAEKSGFNNRNSFSVAFKKFKGMKPSEFLKQYQMD